MPRASQNNCLSEIVVGYFRDAVSMFRRRGVKTDHAINDVAQIFGVTAARGYSLFYRDKVWGVCAGELARIEARFAAHVEREIALSVEYTAALVAKRDVLKRRNACGNLSASGCGSNSTGSRSISAA